MDRAVAESCLTIPPSQCGGVFYAVAGPADDADLRRVLREVPMDGWVHVSMTREPEMSRVHRALGQSGAFVILREADSGHAICVGEYHVSRLFLNGAPATVPYIGALRVIPEWRNRISILRRGLDMVRRLQAARGEPPFMLTAIAADNARAIRLLEANLFGMPDYHRVGRTVTLVLPLGRGRPAAFVRPATADDLPAIAAALWAAGRRSQFMPVWDVPMLHWLIAEGGLDHADFRLVERSGAIAGILAVWDQRAFRQVLIDGYAPWLSRLRPAYNAVASLRGQPVLPPQGTVLPQVALSHFLAPPDAADALALVSDALAHARAKGAGTALLGLDALHPLLGGLRRHFGALCYETSLYLVSWKQSPPPPPLDGNRMPCPEIAVM